MVEMAIFIDVSKCTGCRSCQVACKNWNQLKAEQTTNRGTHENPPDLSATTWNRVRFNEVVKDGKLDWLFLNERCRHCEEPPCMFAAEDVPGAIIKDKSGAVIFTEKTKQLNYEDVRGSCPFDIPRLDEETGQIYKCTMCVDRTANGLKPACVTACPTGTLNYGPKVEMLKLAKKRVEELGGDAALYPGEEYNTFWVLPEPEQDYGLEAKATVAKPRKFAWDKLLSPWGTLGLAAAFIGSLSKEDGVTDQEQAK